MAPSAETSGDWHAGKVELHRGKGVGRGVAPVRLAELQATMDNDGRAPGVGGNGIGATCVGAPLIQIARGGEGEWGSWGLG